MDKVENNLRWMNLMHHEMEIEEKALSKENT